MQNDQKRKFPISHQILFVSIIAFVLFLILEIGSQILIPANLANNPSSLFTLDPVLGWSIEPNQELCYIGGDGAIAYKRSNQYGTLGPNFKSPKPPDHFRAIVVGDSHLHAPIDESKTFSTLLQNKLSKQLDQPVEVINAAVGGYSPYQQLIRVLALQNQVEPDVIIWGYFGGNDLGNCDFGDGPFIDDLFRGRISPQPYEKKMRLFQAPQDPTQNQLTTFLQDTFRLFDLLNYVWVSIDGHRNWSADRDGFYTRMQRGPLRDVDMKEIESLFLSRNDYLQWTSWYSQGASQQLYFKKHPHRLDVALSKVYAIIGAYSLIRQKTDAGIYIVYVPSFLNSPDAAHEPYPTFARLLQVDGLQEQEKILLENIKSVALLNGLHFIDGSYVLDEELGDQSWFDRTAHLTSKSQDILAEAVKDEIVSPEIDETRNQHSLQGINKNSFAFAQNPWPQKAKWHYPQTQSDVKAELIAYCALSSPGPWRFGATWRLDEIPDETLYQTFWKVDETNQSMRPMARFPLEIEKSQSLVTQWSEHDWLSIKPMNELPDKISIESESRERWSGIFDIVWD